MTLTRRFLDNWLKQQKQQQQVQTLLSENEAATDTADIGEDVESSSVKNPLRFYKGLASRDRKTAGSFSRRRRTERRPRYLHQESNAADWIRHNSVADMQACEQQEQHQQMQEEHSKKTHQSLRQYATRDGSKTKQLRPGMVLDPHVKSSTLDTNSSTPDRLTNGTASSPQVEPNASPKKQLIYHKGKLLPVEIMKWPDQMRIPPGDRYRLEEPMRRLYGRRSTFKRLIKMLERSQGLLPPQGPMEFHKPIPMLPKQITESTKRRLKGWYKPLQIFGEEEPLAECPTAQIENKAV